MAGETFLTRQGHEKLQEELKKLRARRQELMLEIQEAVEKGDLKENAEYHAAKEESQKVMNRIGEIEGKLSSARIIEDADIQDGEARIGCTVEIQDARSGEKSTYTLVDSAEADFDTGRISVHSPLAQCLLGKKENETVMAQLPGGKMIYKILKVARTL